MATKRKQQQRACGRCGDKHPEPLPECERYNGWANYETWLVNLWLSNESGSAEYWESEARAALANARGEYGLSRKQTAASALAATLKDAVAEVPESIEGFHADMLNAAYSEVDWYEVAYAFIDAVRP